MATAEIHRLEDHPRFQTATISQGPEARHGDGGILRIRVRITGLADPAPEPESKPRVGGFWWGVFLGWLLGS